jgi:gamma-glutamyltranspeptidase/glutathione hydrolase
MGWVAEPFFTSIGGSGFVTVRTPDGKVEVFDGNNAMPTTVPTERGQGIRRVFLHYSDGMHTGIGAGSVGVPGILAAVYRAWQRHGHIEWAAVLQPAIGVARKGLGFPRTSAYYLSVTWDEIWSRYPDAAKIFSDGSGRPLQEGEPFLQPELAESLELVAQHGPKVFYEGELARALEEEIAADDGFLGVDDLQRYEAFIRAPISSEAFGWKIDSNPPPAVGGALLVQLLARLEGARWDSPTARLEAFAEAQMDALSRRDEIFNEPDTIAADIDSDVRKTAPPSGRSPETTHASSADADGFLCAVTESNGYGAGLVVNGMLLNNTLGEEELNPLGAHSLTPGSRCYSNMAPTIASGDDRIVSVGSPGATRIVGAVAQALIRVAVDGDDLASAVSAPRAHLDRREAGDTLCFEPGLPGDEIQSFLRRPYDEIHMYFGAVQAAEVRSDGRVDAAHDPRRSGGSALI